MSLHRISNNDFHNLTKIYALVYGRKFGTGYLEAYLFPHTHNQEKHHRKPGEHKQDRKYFKDEFDAMTSHVSYKKYSDERDNSS